MNRTLALALVTAGLCAVTAAPATAAPLDAVTTVPASAAPAAAGAAVPTVRDDDPDHDGWERYQDFPNLLLCEAAGAAGVLAGRWEDWRCDDDDTLWVKYSNSEDDDDDWPTT
ncbi:hypothetical protein SUDANB95_02535 [Actinosynnema sp. ALI-1.44]